MKKFYLPFVVGAVFFILAFLITRSGGNSQNEIMNIVKSFHNAILEKDENQLKGILAPKVEIVKHGVKESLTQEKYIAQLMINMDDVSSIEEKNVNISISDETASVKCTLIINWKSYSDVPMQHIGNYTYLFEKHSGNWKIVSITLEAS